MKAEKIFISFIAVVIGIIVAGVAFYIYQSTKILPPSNTKPLSVTKPSPTPPTTIFLSLEQPADEDVVDKKVITVSGKTTKDATVVVSTPVADQVVTPTSTGSFSTTVTIDDGGNQIEVTAIGANGEEATQTRTVTFSTESF
ncbi:MAG: hypothetical protein HYT10_00530 [Candidatus Levybacteria bacterium]|nr:hypothetical protein [Candidatus Levybacteria bacterium]